MNLDRLEDRKPIIWYQESAFWLTLWKRSDEMSFLKGCHSQPLQQTLKALDKAFKDGFDKKQPGKRIPTFKKKGARDSFRYPQGFKLLGSRIYLPKVGWLRFHKSQDIIGTPKNVTVSRGATGWFVSIQVEYEAPEVAHASQTLVGIDLGVARFATLSDGTVFEPLNSFKHHQVHLARAQRSLSRKKKFSENWKKQKRKIARLHHKIAECRRDYLQKASTQISKNHAMIVIEDLKVSNMSRSAKGDRESPGKKVRAKSGLNRAILDQGWYAFRKMLEYKQAWAGGQVLAINPRYTSQTCLACGHRAKENRTSQSEFACQVCGFKAHADLVGAKNILAAGHAALACGDAGLPASMKQEPGGLVTDRYLAA